MNRKFFIEIKAAHGFAKNKSIAAASDFALQCWRGQNAGRFFKITASDHAYCKAEVEFDANDANAGGQLSAELGKQGVEIEMK